jgi:tRNA threonylcarbamoyladenosine biosynthesis protein TsaB
MGCLGFDTTGEALSVAFCENGEVVGEEFYRGEQPHSTKVLAMLDTLFESLKIDQEAVSCLAVTAGPGRYTALRVGMATAKGIAFALNIPMVRISALKALACSAFPRQGPVVTVLDARRRLVYIARFLADGNTLEREIEDQAVAYSEAASMIPGSALLLGDGSRLVIPFLEERKINFCEKEAFIHAKWVALLGEMKFKKNRNRDEVYEGPAYIRNVEVQKNFNHQPVKGGNYAPER